MAFDKQPTLQSTTLQIRPLQESDFDALFVVASDPLLWEQHPASDRYKEDVFRAFFAEAIASGGALLISDTRSGDVLGSSRFHDYRDTEKSIEIGWTFIARQCWGGKINGELKRLMLLHAFDTVEAVLFIIGASNFRSQRAAQKLGATRTGVRQDGANPANLVFTLTRDDYLQVAENPGPSA